jgi:hypothetical protein
MTDHNRETVEELAAIAAATKPRRRRVLREKTYRKTGTDCRRRCRQMVRPTRASTRGRGLPDAAIARDRLDDLGWIVEPAQKRPKPKQDATGQGGGHVS